jgi:glycosyltransferase involved in cell wall biosynthesis
VLVQALALLPAYLVGDGPMRGALLRLAAALGLDAVVHLPGWSYEPARYIAGASVHVVPSREESWSLSAVLALGLGVPVVGTEVADEVPLGQVLRVRASAAQAQRLLAWAQSWSQLPWRVSGGG